MRYRIMIPDGPPSRPTRSWRPLHRFACTASVRSDELGAYILDARYAVRTGMSAYDRARVVEVLTNKIVWDSEDEKELRRIKTP